MKPKKQRPQNRMIGESAPVREPVVPRVAPGAVIGGKRHWSTCPGCGLTRHDVKPGPIISHSHNRVEDGILCYMRCRGCGHRYKAVRPD